MKSVEMSNTKKMVSCLGEIHVWSLKNLVTIKDTDTGCFTYHEKREPATRDHLYVEEKAHYTESRDVTHIPRNKRPEKLKDNLKEFEDLLSTSRCVRSVWISRRTLQMVLNNGTVVTLLVSIHTGDVDRIIIDKSLVGKLSSESLSDVLITNEYLVISYMDKPKLDYIYFLKRPSLDMRKFDKLSAFEPRVCSAELPGPIGRRLDRKLAVNLHKDIVIAWWPTGSDEAWPWSPMTGDKERANFALYSASGPKLDPIAYTRTDFPAISISYSRLHPHQIHSIEHSTTAGEEMTAKISVYECNRNKIQNISVVTIPLKSDVTVFGRSLAEDKVLLGCEDGSLVLYDEHKKVTHMTLAAFVPNLISWHPSGTVVIVASRRADIQVFDTALGPLQFQLIGENPSPQKTLQLTPYFRSHSPLSEISWSPLLDQAEHMLPECNDSLFLMFERGPMAMLQFYLGVFHQGQLTPLTLVSEYIKHRQIDEAINVLAALSWNREGQTCYACLSAIINHLLRMPLTAEREAQLEAALGTFYAPAKSLSEVTVLEYRNHISRLARRFFHVLLRFTRFEKAFLLAVDIGARDLFMDLHYVAKDKGEMVLAEVARRRARKIEAESLGGVVLEDSEEESLDADQYLEDSFSDDELEDKAPPRPPKTIVEPSLGRRPPPPPPPEMSPRLPPRDPRFDPKKRYQQQYPDVQRWHSAQRYVDVSQAVLQDLEKELAAHYADDYTTVMTEEAIIPPPPSHADDTRELQQDESSTTVKVIHFGIV